MSRAMSKAMISLMAAGVLLVGCYDEEAVNREAEQIAAPVDDAVASADDAADRADAAVANIPDLVQAEVAAQMSAVLAQLAEQETQLAEQETQLAEQGTQLAEQETQLAEQETQLAEQGTQLAEQETQLAAQETQLAAHETQLTAHETQLVGHESELVGHEARMVVVEAVVGTPYSASANLADRMTDAEQAIGTPYTTAANLDTRVETLESAGFIATETDPTFTGSPASLITAQQTADWTAAFGWGDHAGAGYLTAEVDPVASAAGYLTTESDPIASAAGYLTSYTETDPVASAAGYLTEEELDVCPVGYVQDLTETQFTLCYDPTSVLASDEMVRVGDFWVDRYESSVWENADCTGAQYGETTTDDYPAGFPDTGNWTTPVYACSIPDVRPSRVVTWFQAQQSCAASGKDLCSNEQWQAAAAGTWDPGSNDGGLGGACNTLGTGSRLAGMAGSAPGGTSSCMSASGAEDMIGNLWEWTGDWYVTGVDWQTANGESAAPWPSGYGTDLTWNLNGRAHNGGGFVAGLPAVALRGGNWADAANAGVFSFNLANGPSHSSTSLGFRCCRGR